MIAQRFLVSGQVQGVFYRASTRERARQLGLRGHAINLPDGRVEVFAAGDADAIESLAGWLREGPSGAQVEHVERSAADAGEAGEGFRIG